MQKKTEELLKANDNIEKIATKNNIKGIITLSFGIVKQGESISTFFPFNINTLEREVSTATQSLDLKEFIRYENLNNPSAITDVKLAFKKGNMQNILLSSGVNGNGFNVTYSPTNQLGAVEESIIVFTAKGNMLYKLTGFVYAKDGETTISK